MIFATDLDRTMIYSKVALAEVPVPDEELMTVEIYENEPFTFMTHSSGEMINRLLEQKILVPVTTRIRHQYERVVLSEMHTPEWAIIANGGVILHKGEEYLPWSKEIIKGMEGTLSVDDARPIVQKLVEEDWVLRMREADGFFLYIIVDKEKISAERLAALSEQFEKENWRTSLQGRKLYFVPKPVDKVKALHYLCDVLGVEKFIAAGDSLLDKPMLDAAHMAFVPAHGELFVGGHTVENGIITEASGVKAGEEILSRVEKELA